MSPFGCVVLVFSAVAFAKNEFAQVAVRTRIIPETTVYSVGSTLSLPCDVDGYPTPHVYWSREGWPLASSDRIIISDAHRLTIAALSLSDAGTYGCHANNTYSSHYSTVKIDVRGQEIPSTCTDNPFFANCKLIVRSKYCHHKYYSSFCCRSCMEAGLLRAEEMQADEYRLRRRK